MSIPENCKLFMIGLRNYNYNLISIADNTTISIFTVALLIANFGLFSQNIKLQFTHFKKAMYVHIYV